MENPLAHQSKLTKRFEERKFTRRNDLTADIRLAIATTALYAMMNSVRGTITQLAKENYVSRTFIYLLVFQLKEAGKSLFGDLTPPSSCLSLREHAIEAILSFRLEGASSLGAISTIMKRFGFKLSSVGSISQILSRIGALLPMTVLAAERTIQYLVFASDEIFSKTTPILVTVDPISTVVLRIELSDSRKAEDWKKHFKCIIGNGFEATQMVSDDGQGLRAGHHEAMSDVIRQSDSYHAIAHNLGSWVIHLEKSAYKAIALEQECEKKLNSAKSEQTQEKRWKAYMLAVDAVDKAISLYDDFSYLYYCLRKELNVFDRYGELRTSQQAKEETIAALSLIGELKHPKIVLAADKIKRALPDLFHYFDIAIKIVNECKTLPISDACLKAYCLSWQSGKAVRKAKKADRKNRAIEQEQGFLANAEYLRPTELSDIQEEIYSRLDKIVQSSAIVECINSIIRPYLNTTKNQVTQELLNLIMHYHNHRRYRDGKRKNKTPMEILTGKEQTADWVSMIFDTIREKDPELLLSP